MAILTQQDLDETGRNYTREYGVAELKKSQLYGAIQAIEDTFTAGAVQTALSNAINTATSPAVLTAPQKRLLVRWWLRSRFDRGNN